MSASTTTDRYAKVIEVSKRVRWEIERDVIRGRHFDHGKAFLPAGLSEQIHAAALKAYRWQYIVSGVSEPRFQKVLFPMLTQAQGQRIQNALAQLTYAVPAPAEVAMPLAA
jgi:hypothetical protein